jgi:hypothetical protein
VSRTSPIGDITTSESVVRVLSPLPASQGTSFFAPPLLFAAAWGVRWTLPTVPDGGSRVLAAILFKSLKDALNRHLDALAPPSPFFYAGPVYDELMGGLKAEADARKKSGKNLRESFPEGSRERPRDEYGKRWNVNRIYASFTASYWLLLGVKSGPFGV